MDEYQKYRDYELSEGVTVRQLQMKLLEIFKYFNTVTAQPGTITNMHQPRPYPITPRTLRSALAILSMLPLMIAYPFLQKYFVSGLTVRGIKD